MVRIIGISGPSSSGKSTLCEYIVRTYLDIEHIRMDDFYKGEKRKTECRRWTDWEHPDNIAFDELAEALKRLKGGRATSVPVFKKGLFQRIGIRIVEPKPLILVEGFLVMHDEPVRDLLDDRVYIDVQEAKQLERRSSRNKDLDVDYFHSVIVPSFRKYGGSAREGAWVINGNGSVEDTIGQFERHFSDRLTR